MDKRYCSVNKTIINERTPAKLNRLNISGQSIVLGKNFNILKYLNAMEKEKIEKETNERYNKRIITLLNPKTPNKKKTKYFAIDTNNISTLKNKNGYKNNKENETFLTSIKDEQNSPSKKLSLKFSYSNKQKRLYDTNRLIHSDIRLSSIIKEIRNKNRNISNNSKNENNKTVINTDNIIAYDQNNIGPIIDINKILNKYKNDNDWDLKIRENNYNDFVSKSKEIKVQNVLKIIMNDEIEKIEAKFKKKEKVLENLKKTVEEDEKNFNQMVKEQKYYNRIIEDFSNKLKDQNKILIYLRESINQHIKKHEYEIMKKIYEIDEFRVYAKFVNYIYGYDVTKYENPIIEKEAKKIDIDELVNKVLDKYKHLMDEENSENVNNIEPDIVYNEMKLIEDRILLALKIKDKEFEDLNKFKKKNDSILEGIRNKKEQLEKEFNYLKEECNYILSINSSKNYEKDLFIIGQDLFNYVIEHFSDNNYNYYYKGNKTNNDTYLNPFETAGLAQKSYKLILEKEVIVDNYLQILKKYEEEDGKIFDKIIYGRKEKLILEKLEAAKERILNKAAIQRMDIEKKSGKIYFIKRKVHQSFPKKKKIKIIIDPKAIKQQEERELLTYQ